MRGTVLIALMLACMPIAGAQIKVVTVHIRVLNGRNGKAIARAESSTTVLPVGTFPDAITTVTDRAGLETVYLPTTSSLRTVVKHHATCDAVPRHQRKLGSHPVSAEAVASTGVVLSDRCGHPAITPTPGELTLFVRPWHWWQRFGY